MDISIYDQLQAAIGLAESKVTGWIEAAIGMLPNFVMAIIVFILFILLSKLVGKLFKRASEQFIENTSLRVLLTKIVRFTVVLVGLFVALSILQLNKAVTSFLAGAGIIGLALGFAFQDTAANFMSGFLMAVKRPFKIKDIIESEGVMGEVKQIDFRTTIIETFQGQDYLIPNRKVYESSLTNYSANNKRRVDIEVGVSYGDDLEKAKEVALSAIKELDGLMDEPVELFYTEFGSSSINFRLHFWINYPDGPPFLEIRSKAIMKIKSAFDKNDITIPFPIRTLDFGIKGGKALDESLNKP